MSGKMMTKIAAAVAACALVGAMSANATDYVLEAGQSDTLSVGDTYDSMTVNGDLTVLGGIVINVKTVTMTNGSVAVSGKNTTFGLGNSNQDYSTAWSMYPDADGQYGHISVTDDNVASKAAGAATFYLRAGDGPVSSDTGYIDFLTLSNGCMNLRAAYNETSLTGRVSVVGSLASTISRPGPRKSEPMFKSGAWALHMQDGAPLTITFGNQGAYLNAEGTTVDFDGNADVSILAGYTSNYPMKLNRGAHFNHNGSLSFKKPIGSYYSCLFQINDSDVIGPGVTNVALDLSVDAGYEARLEIASGVTATMRNVAITRGSNYLTGQGTARIDASAADCSFRANIKADDLLVVEKVGANEMVVSATTNIPTLKVLEGTVRITSDCVISNLFGAAGATLIADGCAVSVTGEARLKGLALETANGGTFVKAGAGRTAAYDPGTISGGLHVASGSVVFSKYGFAQKYWRWTFTKVYNGPAPLHLGRFWIFNTEGGHAAEGLAYKTPSEALTADTCRWKFDPSTNVAVAAGTIDWQGPAYLRANFRNNFFANMNNFAKLSSPVIDPENPISHLAVELRLASTALPVTGYNISTALANDYPMSWTVEASDDGESWTTVETRTDVTHAYPSGTYYFFDGEAAYVAAGNSPVQVRGKPIEFFHFTDYRNDGLATLADPLSVQVDQDATLDLRAFSDGQPINRIAIDLSAGGGTIHGGTVAASGTLALTNVVASGYGLSGALSLTLDGFGETANLKTWAVVVDGAPSKYKVMCSNGQLVLVPPGVCIIFR